MFLMRYTTLTMFYCVVKIPCKIASPVISRRIVFKADFKTDAGFFKKVIILDFWRDVNGGISIKHL